MLKIMQRASETLIPVTLELGGKDSFIVCEDVKFTQCKVNLCCLAVYSIKRAYPVP